jgi:hypothetical protein
MSNRTKQDVVNLIKGLSFAPTIQAILGAQGLRIQGAQGLSPTVIKRAPAQRTRMRVGGLR